MRASRRGVSVVTCAEPLPAWHFLPDVCHVPWRDSSAWCPAFDRLLRPARCLTDATGGPPYLPVAVWRDGRWTPPAWCLWPVSRPVDGAVCADAGYGLAVG